MPDTITSQTFAHHKRRDPWFHLFVMPVFVITVVTSIVSAVRFPNLSHVWMAVFAVAALVALLLVRVYSLKVQDRVIRLEERLRLALLAPETFRARIPELTMSQLIALRFASDGELPALAEKALNGKLSAGEIKQSIKSWRPDLHRV